MSNFQNEHRKQPAADRFGKPGTAYPTANPYDVVITSQSSIAEGSYEPVIYGTPHFKVAAARLCYQAATPGDNSTKTVTRIYANPRLAQEPYNLVQGDDDANDPLYPVFVRSYLLPRGYTKGTIGSALTALIGLTLVSGGTGYTATTGSNKLPLAFSGGDGSGAAGYAEIVAGVVVAVLLTNTGTGYTSVPTVTISGGGGSGASITALLQPTTAKLTNETEQPAEDPYGGYFVRVQRTWETLPGKVVTVSISTDEASDSLVTVTRQKKLLSAITEGTSYVEDISATTVKSEGIDGLFGYEIVTTILNSPHDEEANAKEKDDMIPFQFKGRLNIGMVDFYGTAIGLKTPESDTVMHKTLTWWVISATKPELEFDEMSPDDIVINDVSYRSVLHNETTRVYNGSPVTIPATEPSYSNYTGITEMLFPTGSIAPDAPDAPWIGTRRVIRGSVENDGHPNRWRVQATGVIMR